MKRKKRVEERPKFPGRREEFAGELTRRSGRAPSPAPIRAVLHPGRGGKRTTFPAPTTTASGPGTGCKKIRAPKVGFRRAGFTLDQDC